MLSGFSLPLLALVLEQERTGGDPFCCQTSQATQTGSPDATIRELRIQEVTALGKQLLVPPGTCEDSQGTCTRGEDL